MKLLLPDFLSCQVFLAFLPYHENPKSIKNCFNAKISNTKDGSSYPEVFQRKDVLKICSKFLGEHPCRSVISIKLLCDFIEITLWHGCSPVNLLHIFRTPFRRNTSEWLLLKRVYQSFLMTVQGYQKILGNTLLDKF